MPRNATPPPWRRCRRHRRPTSSVCSSASDFTVGSGPHAGKRSRTPRTTASFFLRGLFLATWSVQRYRQAASPSLLDGRWHGCEYMDGTCARKASLHCATWSPVRGFATACRILVSGVLGASLGGCTASRRYRIRLGIIARKACVLPPKRQTHEFCAQTLHTYTQHSG